MTTSNITWAADVAAARVNELPGAELSHPFGPDADVYKVRGKMFMLVSVAGESPLLTLKARPADATVLRAAYTEITPGYHMNKKHWISLRPLPATPATPAATSEESPRLDVGIVEDLVTESYLLVVEGLPRAQRPVNPDTFGQANAAPTADDLLK